MAPGTRGQGDQCAPSKGPLLLGQADLSVPTFSPNYELPIVTAALAQGMRVVVPDYIGLGTPGMHTYVNRVEEGRAVLDAARAALNVAKQPADSPVGIMGYSQGGGAAAAAAELASNYAPELNIKGAFIGAPPADLFATLGGLNGGLASSLVGFALNSFSSTDPDFARAIDEATTPAGRELLDNLSQSCVVDAIAKYPFLRWENYTTDGRPLMDLALNDPRVKKVLDRQLLGVHPVSTPVRVFGNPYDDMLPNTQVRALASGYCTQGATVEYVEDTLPPLVPEARLGGYHAVSIYTGGGSALAYLTDRFNNLPAPNNCASL